MNEDRDGVSLCTAKATICGILVSAPERISRRMWWAAYR